MLPIAEVSSVGLPDIFGASEVEGHLGFSAMADYRSRKIEVVNGKAYSAAQSQAYAASNANTQACSEPTANYNNSNSNTYNKAPKIKPSKSWSLSDPEVKRRKRVASYKVYTVEGRVKATFRKSFRWMKNKYTEIVQGW